MNQYEQNGLFKEHAVLESVSYYSINRLETSCILIL